MHEAVKKRTRKNLQTKPFDSTLLHGCQMVLFSYQNFQFGKIFEGLAMENVGLFHGHLVYFKAIWQIL
jgi:hypothetical protein